MYGAIIGDLAGSIYEFDQINKIKPINVSKIIDEKSFYSDDTILTIAVLDAILNDIDYLKSLKDYILKYKNYKPNFNPYFKTAFSPNLIKWSESDIIGTSIGNGAMMRISPVGFMFDSEEEIIRNARLATIPSHNSEEAINAAIKIALIIFYLRNGMSVNDAYDKLKIKLEYKPFTRFNTTCHETINNCLYVLASSISFEDAIIKAVSIGGDTDTNACIVGSMAEALYGVSDNLKMQAEEKLPAEFIKVLRKTRK